VDRYNLTDPLSTLPLGERVAEQYDGLGRLVSSGLTKQVAGTAAIQPWRTDTWALDVHGHWAGARANANGQYGRWTNNPEGLRQVQLDNGTTRTIAWSGISAGTDQTIGASWTGTAAQTDGQAQAAGFKHDPVEDGAGNVRFCGEFLYAFDAWNRLVAVWKARPLAGSTDRPRANAPDAGIDVGNWVKRFRYDALGRLIEVQSPMAGPEWPDGKLEHIERFWYDGSRRIQEVVIDPTDLLYVVNKYGTEGLVEYITTGLVNAQTGPPTGLPYRVLNREYIWGTGLGGGVDELHVYFDRDRRPWGVLQDSDGDNVAVTTDAGDVVAEFVYDPYGAVIGQRTYGVHPPLKSGHRGLFAESLTVGTVGTPDPDLGDPEGTLVAWVDGRVLVPNERVLYHMRNRAYDPGPSGATAGRFIQRDPNASGAVLYGGGGGLGSYGAAPVAMVTGLDLAGHVADGVNTYGYLRGRMRGAGDPSGLWLGPLFVEQGVRTTVAAPLMIAGAVAALTQQYASNLEWDVNWAMDWRASDDGHSRMESSWVLEALGGGAQWGYEMSQWDPLFDGVTADPQPEDLALSASWGNPFRWLPGVPKRAPKALNPFRRGVGPHTFGVGAHGRGMLNAFNTYKVQYKPKTPIRTNQTLTDHADIVQLRDPTSGRIIRPDIQWTADDGTKIIIEEVQDGRWQKRAEFYGKIFPTGTFVFIATRNGKKIN
jgi:hypothetical protein